MPLHVVVEQDIFNERGAPVGIFEDATDAAAYAAQLSAGAHGVFTDYEIALDVPLYHKGDKSWQHPKPV